METVGGIMNQDIPRPKNPRLRQAWSLRKKLVYAVLAVIVLCSAGVSWYLLQPEPETQQQVVVVKQKKTTPSTKPEEPVTSTIDCGDKAGFTDESIGMKFCYPETWGKTSVIDAKLAASDTGYRQVVTFSSMPYVQVGGVSDDWTTTVGRDGTCFDPSNQFPELNTYNTQWNGQAGSGANLEFAKRSLPSSAGGYALTEEVSNILQSGVCIRGYKLIDAARYRVASLSYSRDFAPASGITTPAGHVEEPNVLASSQIRAELDSLMASLVRY